jgi:glycosyltransferase involved in cell wall biosynthesis
MRQVIYAWNYLEWGGAQIHLFALIREVRKEFDVLIVLPSGSDEHLLGFIEDLGVRYEFFESGLDLRPAASPPQKIKKHLNKIKSEYRMLRFLERFDLGNSIVHTDLGPWQSLLALIWLALRTEVFITMHNSLGKVPRWRYLLWKIKLRIISHFKTFHVFASNRDCRNYFKGLYSDEKFDQIVVTYTSVDPLEVETALGSEIDRTELSERFGLPAERFLIFCVGQFIDRKGRWTFLEAAREFSKTDERTAFVWIANSRPSAADLEKAKSFGLGEKFILITSDEIGGEHIELFKLLRLADLFALVSFREGLPISLLEAMALGIPSVATDVNAIPEAVRHLGTGWLIEAGDAAALTEAFRTLMADAGLRAKLAAAGRRYVLEHFNDRTVARTALESYRKTLPHK